jgi:hypothetical protein
VGLESANDECEDAEPAGAFSVYRQRIAVSLPKVPACFANRLSRHS